MAAGDLVVFLPGRGDRAEDFEERGFLDAARKAGLEADVLAVDAHLAYYYKRVITERLWEDVVLPARARGYRRLFVVGISLGGLGAITLAQEHPDAVAGLFVLAPYLGEPELTREIEGAGGLARWSGAPSERDFRGVWGFLRGYAAGEPRPPLVARLRRIRPLCVRPPPARVRAAEGSRARDRRAGTTGRPGIASGASSSRAAPSRARFAPAPRPR